MEMARDPDLRPVAGIIFGLTLVVLMYVFIWFIATQPNPIMDQIDPQPNLTPSEEVTP
jgi:hypothetical protein